MNTSNRVESGFAAILLTGALAMIGGCATTGSVSSAASRLDRSAEILYDDLRDERSDPELRREAEGLADAASDFNEEVRDGADRDELRREFDRVAERYHALRDEYGEDRYDSDGRSAFDAVTNAYLDLERELEYRRVAERD